VGGWVTVRAVGDTSRECNGEIGPVILIHGLLILKR
jgi:hypothetical protein